MFYGISIAVLLLIGVSGFFGRGLIYGVLGESDQSCNALSLVYFTVLLALLCLPVVKASRMFESREGGMDGFEERDGEQEGYDERRGYPKADRDYEEGPRYYDMPRRRDAPMRPRARRQEEEYWDDEFLR